MAEDEEPKPRFDTGSGSSGDGSGIPEDFELLEVDDNELQTADDRERANGFIEGLREFIRTSVETEHFDWMAWLNFQETHYPDRIPIPERANKPHVVQEISSMVGKTMYSFDNERSAKAVSDRVNYLLDRWEQQIDIWERMDKEDRAALEYCNRLRFLLYEFQNITPGQNTGTSFEIVTMQFLLRYASFTGVERPPGVTVFLEKICKDTNLEFLRLEPASTFVAQCMPELDKWQNSILAKYQTV